VLSSLQGLQGHIFGCYALKKTQIERTFAYFQYFSSPYWDQIPIATMAMFLFPITINRREPSLFHKLSHAILLSRARIKRQSPFLHP
jgi:hypothetical protein